ncbi:MAG TPA: amidohydrolase family protein, partial [Terriglobales bacterium]|nr:amidohydrolase family protein [Terriglobales bacterium]
VLTMEDDKVLPHRDVLVRDGIIRNVEQHKSKKHLANDATVVGGTGKFLLPGFADMHVHTDFGDEQQLKLYVVHGITTVLNLNGSPQALEWKRKITSGEMLGPTFYTSGQIVDGDPPTNNTHLVVKTRAEAEKTVDEQAAAGYDFVKPYSALSRDEYAGVVDAARRDHVRLVGHVPWDVGVQGTIDAHQDAIAHVEELYRYFVDRHKKPPPDTKPDPSKISTLATSLRDNHVWVITTLSANTDILKQATALDTVLNSPEMKFVPKSYLDDCKTGGDPYTKRGSDWVLQNQIMVPFLFKIAAGLKAAGVPMMAGTDATNPIQVPGISLHDELEQLVEAGLTPYEALVTTTRNPQIFLGRLKDVGTVTAGKTADLVLLDGSPLDSITNTRKIRGVMVRGRWLDYSEIEQVKKDMVAHFGRE